MALALDRDQEWAQDLAVAQDQVVARDRAEAQGRAVARDLVKVLDQLHHQHSKQDARKFRLAHSMGTNHSQDNLCR